MAWVAHGAHPVRRPIGSTLACGEFGAAGGAKSRGDGNGHVHSGFRRNDGLEVAGFWRWRRSCVAAVGFRFRRNCAVTAGGRWSRFREPDELARSLGLGRCGSALRIVAGQASGQHSQTKNRGRERPRVPSERSRQIDSCRVRRRCGYDAFLASPAGAAGALVGAPASGAAGGGVVGAAVVGALHSLVSALPPIICARTSGTGGPP